MALAFGHTTADGQSFSVPAPLMAYSFKTSRGDGVVCNVRIDKISIVFTPEHPSPAQVVEKLQNMYAHLKQTGQMTYKKAGIYKFGYGLTIAKNKSKVFIQAAPKSAKSAGNFVRLEFNPDKLGPNGTRKVFETLAAQLGPDFSQAHLATHARVTSIDLAVDLVNLHLSDLLIEKGDSHKTHVYYGKTGRQETFYGGIHASKKSGSLKFYNKAQELLDTDGVLTGLHLPPEIPLSRLEVKCVTKLPLIRLDEIKNPFMQADVYLVRDQGGPEGSRLWRWFIDSCRMRGIERVKNTMPPELLSGYEQSLAAGYNTVFRADAIWKKWPIALTASGLLPTAN